MRLNVLVCPLLSDDTVSSSIVLKHARVTLNRTTASYVWATLIACIVLVVLQALTFVDNTRAIESLTKAIRGSNAPSGISFRQGDIMYICQSLADPSGKACRAVVDFGKENSTVSSVADAVSISASVVATVS